MIGMQLPLPPQTISETPMQVMQIVLVVFLYPLQQKIKQYLDDVRERAYPTIGIDVTGQ